jgi:hypothetical protein
VMGRLSKREGYQRRLEDTAEEWGIQPNPCPGPKARAIEGASRIPGLNGAELSLLTCLIDRVDVERGFCMPGEKYLTAWTGRPTRTIERARATLKKKGLIRVIKRTHKEGLNETSICLPNWEPLFEAAQRLEWNGTTYARQKVAVPGGVKSGGRGGVKSGGRGGVKSGGIVLLSESSLVESSLLEPEDIKPEARCAREESNLDGEPFFEVQQTPSQAERPKRALQDGDRGEARVTQPVLRLVESSEAATESEAMASPENSSLHHGSEVPREPEEQNEALALAALQRIAEAAALKRIHADPSLTPAMFDRLTPEIEEQAIKAEVKRPGDGAKFIRQAIGLAA